MRRSKPLPTGWAVIRRRILERDDFACRQLIAGGTIRCGETATEVDHVVPAWRGGGDDAANLASLCRRHHREKTGREARDAQGYRRREPEPHPGVIDNGGERYDLA